MLYDDPVLYFRGLTIFRDFSDPQTYYFLPPEAPRIARSAEGSEDYALRLVLYRPDPDAPPPEGMEDGGGFLNLDVDLHVDEAVLEEVREEIRSQFGSDVNLVPVPFMDGSVELVLLGVDRDDENEPFVRKVAGSTVPALYGSQRAAFSTVLDRDGAALMKQVIEEGGVTMALAIYHLTYAGIGPAYNLKITIDYEQVYEKLDLRLGASVSAGDSNTSFVGRAGFHLLMEELKESRAIVVEETDPIPGENGRPAANQQMINEIIGNLMGSRWFKPTLTRPSQIADLGERAGSGSSSSGSSSSTTGSGSASGSSGGSSDASSESSGDDSAASGSGGAAGDTGATAEGEEQGRRPAEWAETSREPSENFSEGREVRHERASSGETETLVITGEGATATVGGRPQEIENGRLQVDVPHDQERDVVVSWPETEGERETFHLFFDYPRPYPDGNDVSGYIAGNPSPAEPVTQATPGRPAGEGARFLPESRAPSSASLRGPAALRAWLQTVEPELELRAHASYEGHDDASQINEELSQRRLDVALGLIPDGFDTSDRQALGHAHAKDDTIPVLSDDPPNDPQGNPSGVANTRGGRPQHRVVLITGRRRGEQAASIEGTLSRPARGEGPPPERPGRPRRPREEEDPTKVEASFEVNLEMIQREERVTATYELNSRKARTREVHPQGQLILEVPDPSEYILEADGAIEFFQFLEIEASTTAQWEPDGIDSIQVQIRYGPRGDGGFIRTGDLMLSADQETDTWRVGVLHENDDDDLPTVYWYEYKVTVHYLQGMALGDQQGAVTSVGVPEADEDGWIRETSRNLVIHPRDVTPAITVNIATGVMQFDVLERVAVELDYGPYQQNLALSPETPEHRLLIRPEEGLEDAVLRTGGTLFYKDGAQVELPQQEWAPQELVVVNEPRENALRVQVMLVDPADRYERVQARLRYEHENRVVEDTFELTDHAQIEEWAVRLEEPDRRDWQYQATLIKNSGDVDTVDWTEGEGDRLMLGFKAEDVIPVHVTWLVPVEGDLLAVKVDLEYEDHRNDVRWEYSELIRGEHTGVFTWSIPVKDPELRTYRYRVTEFRSTGSHEGEWKESTDTQLVLLPGN